MTTAENYYIVVYSCKTGYKGLDKYLTIIPTVHAPALTGMLQNAARFTDKRTATMWLEMNSKLAGAGYEPGTVEELDYTVTYKRNPLAAN